MSKSAIAGALVLSTSFALVVANRIGSIAVGSHAAIGLCVLAIVGWTGVWLEARKSGERLNIGDLIALSLLIILAKEKDRQWFRRWLSSRR